MSVILKLTQPIKAHGDEVKEIELREPTTTDVVEIGFPYLIVVSDDETQAIEIRAKSVLRYISKLGGIPMSSASQICVKDFVDAQGAILGFFGQESIT